MFYCCSSDIYPDNGKIYDLYNLLLISSFLLPSEYINISDLGLAVYTPVDQSIRGRVGTPGYNGVSYRII